MSHHINGSIRDAATDWIIDNAICADPENKPKGIVEEKDRHLLEEWQDDHYTTKPEVTVVNPVRIDRLIQVRQIAETLQNFGTVTLVNGDQIHGYQLLSILTEWILQTPQAWIDFSPSKLQRVAQLLFLRAETIQRGLIPTGLTAPTPKANRPKFHKICDSRKGRREACINAHEGLSFEQAKAKFLLLGIGKLIDEKDETSVICPSCRICPETLIGIANPHVS